ncbi:MAG: DapH/DapD/GlmU-related protein [Planctomycetota bacterium]
MKCFGAKIQGRPFVSQTARIVMPWHLTLEDRSTLAPGAEAYCLGEVILRERCTIAQYAYLCTGTHDLEDARTPLMTGCVEVGPDVFVGAKALVLPGVILGEGCIIGAGAVVAKDTEPWSIVVGNPARPLEKQRKRPTTGNTGEDS